MTPFNLAASAAAVALMDALKGRGPRERQAERSGMKRAAERLKTHREIWKDTPDKSRMTRQRRRWLHRHPDRSKEA